MYNPINTLDNGLVSLLSLVDFVGGKRETSQKWYAKLPDSMKGVGYRLYHNGDKGRKMRGLTQAGALVILSKIGTEKAYTLIAHYTSNAQANAENLQRYKENAPHIEDLYRLQEENHKYKELLLKNNISIGGITNEYPLQSQKRLLPAKSR